MLNPSDLIIKLTGLGVKTAESLNLLGVYTLEHLAFYLPNRYQDKTKITKLNEAMIGSEVLIEAKIQRIEEVFSRQRQLLCYLSDDHNSPIFLRFFHTNQYQKQSFVRGDTVQCFGELKIGRHGFEMLHPEYRLISKGQPALLAATLSPVYPLTANIRQAQLQKWIDIALEVMQKSNIQDNFTALLDGSPTLKQALTLLHHPQKNEDTQKIADFVHPAQQRLIIEELCAYQLSMLRLKRQRKTKAAFIFQPKKQLEQQLLNALPFQLTNAQNRCIKQINTDVSSNQPMLRLLQGDVGSGKTIVAVFACLRAIANGFQAAIMAPTEILAAQHFQSFLNYLSPLNIEIVFLVGGQKAQHRKTQLNKIKVGEANIVVGTHALFQQTVSFCKLGLIVIDEQHKFGVHQRLSLAKKSAKTPHQLVMTATPIPRSLTMSAYADLDSSVIDELPPGRKPVQTIALNNQKKHKVIDKIKRVCADGKQVYWVCTLVEESEVLRAESAKNTQHYLQQNLTNFVVTLIHGKMKKDEKTQIMDDFNHKKINVLVATTVIEVGVDVSNANLMVIENAERLGLAQLHQLRGRVGRGVDESLCILIYQPPLSDNAKQRINILRQSNDGFLIAKKDLELRGPGEILGTQQAGVVNMKIANIVRDAYLLNQVRDTTKQLIQLDNDSQQVIISRWVDEQKTQYANA